MKAVIEQAVRRYTVSNVYLRKGAGVVRPDAAYGDYSKIYISTHPTRREAEAEADRLNGDTRYADARAADAVRLAEAKARREAEGPRARDRNRYAGVCCKCGANVPEGEGWLYRHSGANMGRKALPFNRRSNYDVRVRCESCGDPTRD